MQADSSPFNLYISSQLLHLSFAEHDKQLSEHK